MALLLLKLLPVGSYKAGLKIGQLRFPSSDSKLCLRYWFVIGGSLVPEGAQFERVGAFFGIHQDQ